MAVASLCSQPTYEELKQEENERLIKKARQFSAYLWGIETKLRQVVGVKNGEFSAYLWGIETNACHNRVHGSDRSQPTYEELKPCRRRSRE